MQAIADLLDDRLDKKLAANLQPIHDRLDSVDSRLDSMDSRLSKIESRQSRIEVKIENETDRAIKILGEGHQVIIRRLDEDLGLEGRVETVEHKVSALEYAVKK